MNLYYASCGHILGKCRSHNEARDKISHSAVGVEESEGQMPRQEFALWQVD